MEHRIAGKAGSTLFEALIAAGLAVESPCGGAGTCGKCRVAVRSQDLDDGHDARERPDPWGGEGRTRLACRTRFVRDGHATVRIEDAPMHIVEESALAVPAGEPAVRLLDIQLSAPSLEDASPELARVEKATGARVRTSLVLPRLLGETLGPQSVEAASGHGASAPQVLGGRRFRARIQEGGHLALTWEDRALVAAVDIGTTTVAVRLFDAAGDTPLGAGARANIQRWAGADVIARIGACTQAAQFARLTGGIAGQIASMLLALVAEAGCESGSLARIVVAGNPTMIHILAGVHPGGIARAPFAPVFSSAFDLGASESPLGNHFAPDCRTILIPGISAYVGADLVAGALACGLAHSGESRGPRLLLDLGTNGEIMLFAHGRSWCCSAAAGPAFEGAAIEFGMPSIPGAIDHVRVEDGGIGISVIGDGKATGLCGSGILDAVAVLLGCGAIDPTGRIDPDGAGGRLDPACFVDFEGKPAILVDSGSGILLTQDDIRQVQLAKGAVAAGIEVLLSQAGLAAEDIELVYLAGGFGSRLDPESALGIGLVPPATSGRIQAVGNASLAGASIVALRAGSLATCESLATDCQAIELSGMPEFVNAFQMAMFFPGLEDDED